MSKLKSCVLAVMAVAWAATALAQGADAGSLRGRLTDSSGGALPGVTITVTSPVVMGGSMVAVTSGEGIYRFPTLPPGVYEIKMELTSFKTVVIPNVRINVGLALTIDRQLEVATVAESITVVGEAPLIDTKHTSSESTISMGSIEISPNSFNCFLTVSASRPEPGISKKSFCKRANGLF